MKNNFKKIIGLSLSVLSLTFNSRAEEAAPRTEARTSSNLLKKITATLAFEAYGPSTSNWSAYRPDVDKAKEADSNKQVFSKNKLTLAYKLDETKSAGVGLASYFYSTTGTSFKDPYVFVKDSQFIRSGQYNMDAAVRLYAGLSEDSRNKYHTPLGTKLVQDSTYRLGSSSASLGFYSEIHWYIHSQRIAGDRDLEYYLVPYGKYLLSKTVSAILGLKIQAYQKIGRSAFDLDAEPNLLSPGIEWKPIKSVTVNPYLDIPVSRVAWNMTTVNLNLSWKFL